MKRLDDMDLLLICAHPENENRGQLLLRRTEQIKSPEPTSARIMSPIDGNFYLIKLEESRNSRTSLVIPQNQHSDPQLNPNL